MEHFQFSRQDRYKQRIKFDFPDYFSNFDYEMGSKKGCLVFPLFIGFKDIVPTYHINSAFWAAHSFLVNSDIVEAQVPIYFYIEKQLWAVAEDQFRRSGIPESRFMLYERPNYTPAGDGQWFTQELYLILDERFDGYDNVLFFDTDLFLASAGSKNPFKISQLWERRDRRLMSTCNIVPYLSRNPRWGYFYELPEDEGRKKWIRLAEQALGVRTERVHHSRGVIHSFCPEFLSPDFKTFIHTAVHLFGSEENTLSLYMQWSGKMLEDLIQTWCVPLVQSAEEMREAAQTATHFFTHIRRGLMEAPEDEAAWREYIGQERRLG